MFVSRAAFDAANPWAPIPPDAPIVAGYPDGEYADLAELEARFPAAYHLGITVTGLPGYPVADCENGDLTPTQAVMWARLELGRTGGPPPTIYSNEATYPELVTALASMGMSFADPDEWPARGVYWWAAGYTNSPYLAPGSVATQWAGGITAPYDISSTNGLWPYLTAPTPPAGGITLTGMLTKGAGFAPTPSGRGYWEVQADGAVFSHGDAMYHGGMNPGPDGKPQLAAEIVDMDSHPTNGGYWLVGADGGVFCFGGVGFYGSTGGIKLDQPVTKIRATKTGNGYWLFAADGGVFPFGDAGFYGAGQ